MAGFSVKNRGLAPDSYTSGSVFKSQNSPYVVANGRTDAAVSAAIGSLPTVAHPTLGNIQWGTVVLPPGTYTFSNTINLSSYVHIDGMKRAIVTRAGGFNGACFSAASAITDFALNGIVWDNNATANFMVQLPNGISSFQMLWARFQNTSGSPFQINGGVALSTDITAEDIRLYAVGSPSNQNGLEFYDCANLSIKGIKTLIQSGTSALSALNIQNLGSAPTLYNINVEDVEADTPNATVIFLRNNFGGVIDGASFKGIRGQGIGSASIQKGLLDIGEQAAGTAGQSTTRNVHVEDVEARDWFGALVTIGTADSGGGNVYDFSVTDVRGDCQKADGSGVDTTRTSSVLNITGAQYGTIEGIIARNTGLGGVRFITTTFQPPAYVRCTNIDVEGCVQNPSGGGWHETGIYMDSGTHDITFVNPRSANNYSAANPGGTQVGAGIGCAAASSSVQCNNVTIINPVCTDTRAGGSQFQDYGIRIGETDPDAWQPNNWTIVLGDLRSNGVGTIKQYGTSGHGHLTQNNRGDAGNTTAIITATNATWPIPGGANFLEITCVGGGGGGGGGGAASTAITQAGGSGGSSGGSSTQTVAVGANTTLNVTIGAGGTGGNGGAAAGNNAGSAGSGSADTTVTGTGISVKGRAGGAGNGGAAGSTTAVQAVAFGSTTAQKQDSQGGPGLGGTSGGSTSASAGGDALGYCAAGGGGGGGATTTNGGGGGGAGSQIASGAAGGSGASGTSSGVAGTAAAANTGAGGGGGGGGTNNTGAGGNGGNGGSGYVIIKVVG